MATRKYHIITPDEREQIEQMFNAGDAVDYIAEQIGVHRGTLYRELNRGIDRRGIYHAKTAQALVDKPRKRWIGRGRRRKNGNSEK